jgi:D-3-phosphoglycerate dehydrogenase
MAFKVLVSKIVLGEAAPRLRELGYEVVESAGHEAETLRREIADCDALISTAHDQLTREVLLAGKRLKAVSCVGVGYDHIDLDAAGELGIYVLNTPVANTNSVAEHTMYLLIACARNAREVTDLLLGGDFGAARKKRAMQVAGRVLGLVGCGNIGRMVAKKAALGFGMTVIGYDPFVRPGQKLEYITLVESADDVYRNADFVSLHIPATPETRASVGKRQFELMKPTAFFINAARGAVVVEEDLIEAIENKTIAGAGLDVFEQEPPAPGNPLLSMPNVVATPHYAAASRVAWDTMVLHSIQGAVEVLGRKAPTWPVRQPDPKAHERRWQ